jgi:hypothetical protein
MVMPGFPKLPGLNGLIILSFLLLFSLASFASPSETDDGLQAEEREALQEAKDPEQRLKVYLNIADSRLKDVLLQTKKLDKENSAKAALGFRTAVIGADDSVAKVPSDDKNFKKLILNLHKAMRKYNFALIRALDKAAEDFRKYIQSAYEVSQRVQDGAEIQMARFK